MSVLTALSGLTGVADQARDGRFVLGLGTQIRAQIEERFGAAFDRPVDRMVGLVAALRAIFDS